MDWGRRRGDPPALIQSRLEAPTLTRVGVFVFVHPAAHAVERRSWRTHSRGMSERLRACRPATSALANSLSFVVLPSERRRIREVAEREADGESLWTDEFDPRSRVRIAEIWRLMDENLSSYDRQLREEVGAILRGWAGWQVRAFDADDFRGTSDHTLTLDALAAAYAAAKRMDEYSETPAVFMEVVNQILNEHRIAHKFVDGELIPFESDELLQEVVEPSLRLLVGSGLQGAHDAYLKALKEISRNDPADAITDAGTALQETLTALGCRGNALGPLLKDARKNGLLAGHDQNLSDGILKFADWASADRSESGDAHTSSSATNADAWLMVHVAGALIVRLVDPAKRGNL